MNIEHPIAAFTQLRREAVELKELGSTWIDFKPEIKAVDV
jgi:hypothetical protein